jgi:hypothetical protein
VVIRENSADILGKNESCKPHSVSGAEEIQSIDSCQIPYLPLPEGFPHQSTEQ